MMQKYIILILRKFIFDIVKMISLFIQSVYSKTVTGKYSESKLWDTLKENLLIVDCVFANLGGWSAYAPVWIDGGLGNKIEVITTMFVECSAQTNGPFAFEGKFFLKFDKVADARNKPGSGGVGVILAKSDTPVKGVITDR